MSVGIILLVLACVPPLIFMLAAMLVSTLFMGALGWFWIVHKWQQIVDWAWQDIDIRTDEYSPTTREIKKAKEVSNYLDTDSNINLLITPLDTSWFNVQSKSWGAPERYFCNHAKCKSGDKPLPYADMPYVHIRKMIYDYKGEEPEVDIEITCLRCMTTEQEIARFERNANLMDL